MTHTPDRRTEDQLDRSAVREVRAGNADAFSSIVSRYTGRVFALAVRAVGNRDDAEEATQEIFLRAFRAIHSYRQNRRFFPWLYTIALNYLRSLHRKSGLTGGDSALPLTEDVLPDAGGGPHTQPERHVIVSEASQFVRDAIDALPRGYRDVFVLRQMRGLSTADVGGLLGLPENTVKTHLRRARARLQHYMAEAGIEGPDV